jgi:predicted MPP superfamily phosphohydrolase
MNYLLFALASFGNAYLLMVLVNVVYSQPYHRHFLKAFRAIMGLLIFGSPIAFLCLLGAAPWPIIANAFDTGSRLPLAIYLLMVLAMALVVFPIVTARRALRPRPAAVVSETTVTIDVAKELGSPPFGDGESLHMAKLPFNDIFRVDFTTLTLALPDVPASWDGLTLLQISDLHFYRTPAREFYDCVVRRCLAEGAPDLLLITGDVIDDDSLIAWIEPVLKPLIDSSPAFAVLGNHDWWQDFAGVRAELRRLGVHVVSNAWEQIEIRGEKLTVVGHEGPWFHPGPDLSACPAAGFRLLLSHTPDNIRWAKRNGVSLMLSGHVHGGQVRIPLMGSIFVPSKFSRRYDMGTFYEAPTLLHVGRGLSGKEPLRFHCRPQVTRIVLKA